MTTNEIEHQVTLQKWREQIQICRSSGQAVKQWCRENNVSWSTYYRWERELFGPLHKERVALPAEKPEFVELQPKQMHKLQQFRDRPPLVTTVCTGRMTVEFYMGADPSVMNALIQAINHVE